MAETSDDGILSPELIQRDIASLEKIEKLYAENGEIVGLCRALRRKIEEQLRPTNAQQIQADISTLSAIEQRCQEKTTLRLCQTLRSRLEGQLRPRRSIVLNPSLGPKGMFVDLLERESTDVLADRLVLKLLEAKTNHGRRTRTIPETVFVREFEISLQQLWQLETEVNGMLLARGYKLGKRDERPRAESRRLYISKITGPRGRETLTSAQ
ncbi:MAG: hypothetical protein PHO20_00480 [Candidatus Peribacteraceae bacterium]|nr:hypothetical protein [Candidatus Peribacteraceae bacterium]MDD5739229.1 hypothetical protein [Candidatus Peribacteraceae bacterium]